MPDLFLWLGVLGALGFLVAALVEGAIRPDYRPTYHVVSALALGDRGWVQTANFLIAGAMMTMAAIASFWVVSGWIAPALLVVFGLAVVASGLFTMDPMRGYPPGTPPGDPETTSRSHDLHDAFGVAVFGSLPAAALAFAFTLTDPPWAGYSAITAGALVILLVVFIRAWASNSPRSGLAQRTMIVVGWVWVALLCVHLATR